MKTNILYLISFLSLDKTPKINISHMVAKEHPEMIERKQLLVAVDVLDSDEVAEDASIDHYSAALDEEDGSGLLGAGVTEEV